MSPLRGEEYTGRSVEEAIERGLRALHKKRTEVDIEILEKGKPANVLGIGGEDARVLLTFQEEEAPPEPELLELMGIEANVKIDDRPHSEGIDVLGPDLGALI